MTCHRGRCGSPRSRPPATGRRPSSRPPPSTHRGIDPLGLHYNAKLRGQPSFRPGGGEENRRPPSLALPLAAQWEGIQRAREASTTSRSKASRPKVDPRVPFISFYLSGPETTGVSGTWLEANVIRRIDPLRAHSAPGGCARRSIKSRQAYSSYPDSGEAPASTSFRRADCALPTSIRGAAGTEAGATGFSPLGNPPRASAPYSVTAACRMIHDVPPRPLRVTS